MANIFEIANKVGDLLHMRLSNNHQNFQKGAVIPSPSASISRSAISILLLCTLLASSGTDVQ